jgi:hypothetical protein
MAELKIEELAEMVADTVLDKFEYEGKTIREWVEDIAEADHVGKWIPVSEKLPEEGEEVLVSCYDTYHKKVIVARYQGELYGFTCGLVPAWMPLPEPYKAESENEA